MNDTPVPNIVFMLGCPRSGTTLLRDVLRSHPDICCAEETHFFRWADPYGTAAYRRAMKSKIFQKHRAIDKISEEEFDQLLDRSRTRAELWTNYMSLFAGRKKPEATTWLDKSPQNVFGMSLILSEMKTAKIIHIVRNPLNVVASFQINKTFPIKELIGAANYWRESVAIIAAEKRNSPDKIYELSYEKLTINACEELEKLYAFMGVGSSEIGYPLEEIRPERNLYENCLNRDQLSIVKKICENWAAHYGYLLEMPRRD